MSGNYDEDTDCQVICGFWWQQDTLDNFFKTELVNRKFIGKVPHSPNYPKNCVNPYSDTSNCYVLGYYIADTIFYGHSVRETDALGVEPYMTCGRQKVKNYAIYLFANDKKLNLPKLEYYDSGTYFDVLDYLGFMPGNMYCLSM